MKDIIQKKLESYRAQNPEEEENAIKEITQEVALYALGQSGFFEKACFQGGTALRILYKLDRFSEDLDFALAQKDEHFSIIPYLEQTSKIMKKYGYDIEITGKEEIERSVKKHFLKDESIVKLLTFKHSSDLRKKIKVKIELDTNPPKGSSSEIKYCDFPIDFSVRSHDLPSLMAGKLHALLCRTFLKGRDWYDFSWYVAQGIQPNFLFLQNSLYQQGPLKDLEIEVNSDWLKKNMYSKVNSVDWKDAREDVFRFLKEDKLQSLSLWSEDFFLSKVDKMGA